MLKYKLQVTSSELKESVALLKKLGEPSSELATQFLVNSKDRLEKDLSNLIIEHTSDDNEDPILIFFENCCNNALNNVALTIATYNDIFLITSTDDNK